MSIDQTTRFLSLCQQDKVTEVKALLEGGHSASTANGAGQSPLHIAALWGNFATCQVLVDAGGNLNATNNISGATPLHCCAASNKDIAGRLKCAQLLVAKGADTTILDFRNQAAWKYTTDTQLIELLGGTPGEDDDDDDMEDDDEEVPDSQKTPVTLVTGFLGAGKTTLVNYILKEKHGKRIAVVENEFGEVNIDQDLVQENLRATEDIISMDNGCVCCTVRGDLVNAFKQLAQRPEKFDAIIIETTGLADPAPVAFTFNSRPELSQKFRIDGILTLVDAKHIRQHLDTVKEDGAVNEAVQQVAFADKILLNKTDLVTPAEKEEVRHTLFDINQYAEVIECQNSRVPLDKLLGLGTFSLERVQDLVDPEDFEDDEEEEEHDHGHGHGQAEPAIHDHGHGHEADCKEEDCKEEASHEHGHGHAEAPEEKKSSGGHDHGHGHDHGGEVKEKRKRKNHLSGVSSVGLTATGDLDMRTFNQFMNTLLQERASDLYRSKGVLKFKGRQEKYLFHGVHEQIQFGPAESTWAEGETPVNKLVFIGRKLDRQELSDKFMNCLSGQ